jgi:hypothetical protein
MTDETETEEIDPVTETEKIETDKEQEESRGEFGDSEAGPDTNESSPELYPQPGTGYLKDA